MDDVEGANRVGIEAVLINRPGREPNTAPRMIESLLEIEQIVFPDG
jgi:FMN phosphatase YigB (HAD superfamily)